MSDRNYESPKSEKVFNNDRLHDELRNDAVRHDTELVDKVYKGLNLQKDQGAISIQEEITSKLQGFERKTTISITKG